MPRYLIRDLNFGCMAKIAYSLQVPFLPTFETTDQMLKYGEILKLCYMVKFQYFCPVFC